MNIKTKNAGVPEPHAPNTKTIGGQPIMATKAYAWVKHGFKPVLDYQQIKQGKDKGKFEVTLTDGRKSISADGRIIDSRSK
jgi:hypothetical protein